MFGKTCRKTLVLFLASLILVFQLSQTFAVKPKAKPQGVGDWMGNKIEIVPAAFIAYPDPKQGILHFLQGVTLAMQLDAGTIVFNGHKGVSYAVNADNHYVEAKTASQVPTALHTGLHTSLSAALQSTLGHEQKVVSGNQAAEISGVALTASGKVYNHLIIRPNHNDGDLVALQVKVKAVSAGFGYGGALTTNGEVYVWGAGNPDFLDGTAEKPCASVVCLHPVDWMAVDGSAQTRANAVYEPHKVEGLENIRYFSLGFRIAAAMDNKGQVFVWTHDDKPFKVGQVLHGTPAEYECSAFKDGFSPYWKAIQAATMKYADAKHPIPESLLAAIAAQETGGAGASFPHNIQENNPNGFGTGPFQIDFSGARKDYYPGITPSEVFAPDALSKFPDLQDAFDDKGITPTQANDPVSAAEYAAKLLEEGWNRFGSEDTALGYYNGGPPGGKNPGITSPQNWGKDDNLRYPDSVKRHQKLIQDALTRCGMP